MDIQLFIRKIVFPEFHFAGMAGFVSGVFRAVAGDGIQGWGVMSRGHMLSPAISKHPFQVSRQAVKTWIDVLDLEDHSA